MPSGSNAIAVVSGGSLVTAHLIRELAARFISSKIEFADKVRGIAAVAAFFKTSSRMATAGDRRPNAEYHAMARG